MTAALQYAPAQSGKRDTRETVRSSSYPLFDWLRIMLASLVALNHQGMPAVGPIDGNLAVVVFLALSGWLIGGVLLGSMISDLPRFFFNRATRIWIPYASAIVMVYGLAALRDGADSYWFKYLFYDLTFTHTLFTEFPRALWEMPLAGTANHFWSISVEEIFYLIAPIVIVFLPYGKTVWAWIPISLLLLAAQSVFAPVALGVLAALTARNFPGWYDTQRARLLVWVAIAASLALCFIADTPAMRAIFAVILVQGLAFPGERGRLGVFFGAVSYPFYLNHWMGAFLINGVLKFVPPIPPALSILASYLVAIAAGIVTWALIDRWVMPARDAWFTHRRGVILGCIAYGLVAVGLIGGLVIHAHGG